MFSNQLILSDYNNINIDFKHYLQSKDSIIWKNCKNLNIIINSKINKLIFQNCYNINIHCSGTISGIDIENSKQFNIQPIPPYEIYYIDCFRSNVTLSLDKNIINKNLIKIKNQISNIVIRRL